MGIPLVDLRAGFDEIREDVLNGMQSVLESMQLLLGPNTVALEHEFSRFVGAEDCIAVSNGTDALVLALKALDIGQGDEVIVPSHTFFATAEAIIHVGAKPIFVDIDEATYTMDPAAVDAAVTGRTRAIMAVHLYGHPSDTETLNKVAASRGIALIEDASQAHGARVRGRSVGTLGAISGFSCYFTKNLGAYGEAGLVTTMNRDVAARVRVLRNHGHVTKERHDAVGYNFRMDELQAVVLRAKLQRLDNYNRRRQMVARWYQERLRDVTSLTLPISASWAEHVFHLYVVRCMHRDALRAHLAACGVGTGIHYAIPVHLQPAMTACGYRRGALPITERLCGEILSLPMYPQLTESQVDEVCGAVRAFYSKSDAPSAPLL